MALRTIVRATVIRPAHGAIWLNVGRQEAENLEPRNRCIRRDKQRGGIRTHERPNGPKGFSSLLRLSARTGGRCAGALEHFERRNGIPGVNRRTATFIERPYERLVKLGPSAILARNPIPPLAPDELAPARLRFDPPLQWTSWPHARPQRLLLSVQLTHDVGGIRTKHS
jgi:hypothetical protein